MSQVGLAMAEARAVAANKGKPPEKSIVFDEGRLIVTPTMATRMLELHPYQGQRKMTKDHVDRLAAMMTNGVWTPGSQLAFGVLPDKSRHLVNGQHRLTAVVESGRPQQFQILLLNAKSQKDLDDLYHRFDTVQRVRHDGAMLRSSSFAEEAGVTWELGAQALTAATIIANNMRFPNRMTADPYLRTPDGKLAAAEPWWPIVREYADLTDGSEKKVRRSLRQVTVLSVGMVTLKYQPVKARPFWRGIAENDGLRKGDPRRTLAMTLLQRSLVGEARNLGIVLAAKAWNAWFNDEQCSMLRYDPGNPAILGTPFAKR